MLPVASQRREQQSQTIMLSFYFGVTYIHRALVCISTIQQENFPRYVLELRRGNFYHSSGMWRDYNPFPWYESLLKLLGNRVRPGRNKTDGRRREIQATSRKSLGSVLRGRCANYSCRMYAVGLLIQNSSMIFCYWSWEWRLWSNNDSGHEVSPSPKVIEEEFRAYGSDKIRHWI